MWHCVVMNIYLGELFVSKFTLNIFYAVCKVEWNVCVFIFTFLNRRTPVYYLGFKYKQIRVIWLSIRGRNCLWLEALFCVKHFPCFIHIVDLINLNMDSMGYANWLNPSPFMKIVWNLLLFHTHTKPINKTKCNSE